MASTAAPDRSFGNRGTLWSCVPVLFSDGLTVRDPESHFVGGTALAMRRFTSGAASIIVWGWDFNFPWARNFTRIRVVTLARDGAPEENRRNDGTRVTDLSDVETWAAAPASCVTPQGALAVLVRQGLNNPWYELFTIRDVIQGNLVVTRQPINIAALFDSPLGTIRIAADNADFGIVSSGGGRHLRVALLRAAGAIIQDIDLN